MVYNIVMKDGVKVFDTKEKKVLLNVLFEKCIIDKK